MTQTTHTYAASLSWGGDEPTAEAEVEVEFAFAPATEPSGRFGPPENYDPGSGPEIDVTRILKIDGKAAPFGTYWGHTEAEWLAEIREKLEGSEEHCAAMEAIALQDEAYRRDSFLEAEAEERRSWRP